VPDGTIDEPDGEELGCCTLGDTADVDELSKEDDMEERAGVELDCCTLDDTVGADVLLTEDAELDEADVELDCSAPGDPTNADRLLAEIVLAEATDVEEPPVEDTEGEEAATELDTAGEEEALKGEEAGADDAGTETEPVGSAEEPDTGVLDTTELDAIRAEACDALTAGMFEPAKDDD
ncbi:hypothetical protein LTS18_007771, partial [Coniosporium uncinatum]